MKQSLARANCAHPNLECFLKPISRSTSYMGVAKTHVDYVDFLTYAHENVLFASLPFSDCYTSSLANDYPQSYC